MLLNHTFETDELYDFLKVFSKVSEADLHGLHSALEEGNADEAARSAHSIKGAALTLGLERISELARTIEENADQQRLEGLSAVAHLLASELFMLDELVAQHDANA